MEGILPLYGKIIDAPIARRIPLAAGHRLQSTPALVKVKFKSVVPTNDLSIADEAILFSPKQACRQE
jgi:hypothetical protein